VIELSPAAKLPQIFLPISITYVHRQWLWQHRGKLACWLLYVDAKGERQWKPRRTSRLASGSGKWFGSGRSV